MASLDLMYIDIDVLATIQGWLKQNDYELSLAGHYITLCKLKPMNGSFAYTNDDAIDFENFNALLEWIRTNA